MATIQVRKIPERVHRAYQRRAEAAGMSLQEYMRSELIRNAELCTPAEVVADVEERLGRRKGQRGMRGSSAALVRADRDSH